MHIPVMSDRVIEYMNPKSGGVYLDATVGEGGHARAILEASAPHGHVVGIDMDEKALITAKNNLKDYEDRVEFFHANYKDIEEVVSNTGVRKFDGIIVDLGFSSSQIDNPERGFSFLADGPLDMRYDTSSGITAYDVVNKFSADKLAMIIREYGEEKRYRSIVKAIINARAGSRITSTAGLASIISKTAKGHSRIHPATKTFQAIRIFVNNELENLKAFFKTVGDFINVNGVLVIISFHSLEDRIVKHVFRQFSKLTPPVFRILTRKPALPDEQELRGNYRARSARLRAVQRIG